MTPTEIKKALKKDYASIQRAVEQSQDLKDYIEAAFRAARKGQQTHNRSYPTSQQFTSCDYARYFVIKWFRAPVVVTDAFSAAGIRIDALKASAARIGCDKYYPDLVPDLSATEGIDDGRDMR